MRIGLANGCFDGLHDGHRHFLTEARAHCDFLILAVNSDASVRHLKGEGRPLEPLGVRMLKVYRYADAVIPFDGHDDRLLMSLRPDVLVKGYDHAAGEVLALRQRGWKTHHHPMHLVRVVRLSHLPGFSTTLQIDRARGTTHA